MSRASRGCLLLALLPLLAACAGWMPRGPREMRAGCATCVYDLPGRGCPLAVIVDGQPVLVQGVPTPGHETGICDREIRARVTGRMEGGTFVATAFEPLPD